MSSPKSDRLSNLPSRLLDAVEKLGNRLPEPATLFAIGTIVIMLLSGLAASMKWTVIKPSLSATQSNEGSSEVLVAHSLLNSEGLWWLTEHLVENFINFPPLGIVLVGMLGIGLAEHSGLLPALFRRTMSKIPSYYLTPASVFIGILSSLAMDAGYIVLPPLAAAIYAAAGRSPLAGIAAVVAGIAAGFSANLVITTLDPLLAGLTQLAAKFLDPNYQVAETANWWFMIASTFVLTSVGWLVTAVWVEPRLNSSGHETSQRQSSIVEASDRSNVERGLRAAGISLLLALVLVLVCIWVPGAPLYGEGARFSRWIEAIVPLLFFLFFVPGVAYGLGAGTIKNDRDVVRMLGQTMRSLGPYIVLTFFAAQFLGCFQYSRLGEMLAISGGSLLAQLQLPQAILILTFILVVMAGNLLIGSASAKYAFFAPVFVPMLMQVGISPELTQAAYRVGDSVTNVITPLNPYLVIVLAQMQRYAPKAGFGTLISLMLPYSLVFAVIWIGLLLIWTLTGLPLGPAGPLQYTPF